MIDSMIANWWYEKVDTNMEETKLLQQNEAPDQFP